MSPGFQPSPATPPECPRGLSPHRSRSESGTGHAGNQAGWSRSEKAADYQVGISPGDRVIFHGSELQGRIGSGLRLAARHRRIGARPCSRHLNQGDRSRWVGPPPRCTRRGGVNKTPPAGFNKSRPYRSRVRRRGRFPKIRPSIPHVFWIAYLPAADNDNVVNKFCGWSFSNRVLLAISGQHDAYRLIGRAPERDFRIP